MLLNFIPQITSVVEDALKLIPDGDAREKAKSQVDTMLMDLVKQEANNQQAINLQEAQSTNPFVAGWRPFIGWVCGFALFWHFLFHPVIETVLLSMGIEVHFVDIEYQNVLHLVIAILGLSGIHTYEKIKTK